MTNQLTALKALAVKVEAGTVEGLFYPLFERAFYIGGFDMIEKVSKASHAYNGALDAAESLCKAVVPEWQWGIGMDGKARLFNGHHYIKVGGETRARALLHGAIKAKIWELAQ